MTTQTCTSQQAQKNSQDLQVVITGGGSVGLFFALLLDIDREIKSTVYDRRWCVRNGRVVWKGLEEGHSRRGQVVTLQSNVYSMLPALIQQFLFGDGQMEEMWPSSPGSPPQLGRPRNLPIREIEDRLLDLARQRGLDLRPERYDASTAPPPYVLAICEGSRSPTRERYSSKFGRADAELYTYDGTPLTEVVLGLHMKSKLTSSETVVYTTLNNRFLGNTLRGSGYVNMRLTHAEAEEAVGASADGAVQCTQAHPCTFARSDGTLRCTTHGALFKPAIDPSSELWPRILDGLKLFEIDEEDLHAVTVFRMGLPVHRPRFTCELIPGRFAFLLGDAAISSHVWPGRGLNGGLAGALSLALCLSTRWRSREFRLADFTRHEGAMGMLQFRNQNRVAKTVLMSDRSGKPRPIEARINDGLTPPFDPAVDKTRLLARFRELCTRLDGRLCGPMPDEQAFLGRLEKLSPSTLKVLVETGPWITEEVGGEEVDIASLYRT